MKYLKGMYTDCAEVDQPQGTYRFAKNIIDGNVIGAKENEDGFHDAGLLAPYSVIGIIPVDTGFVVFSTTNTNSEIGYVERTGADLDYTAIYNDPALDFNLDNPIKGEYRIDVDGNRSVAWVDGRNTPRILNIDDATVDNVQDLNVFRDVNNPFISSSAINDLGGALPTGAYTLITKYRNRDGSETDWFVHDHVFYINDDSKSLPFNENDGAPGGTISSKSISATFSGTDSRYDTLLVGYIRSIAQVVTTAQVLALSNGGSSITITITGTETSTDLSIDEVLTGNASYITAKAITQLGGQLFLANLSADKIPELQQIAMDIQINYTQDLITVVSNTGNHKDNLPPSFMPGEVYAFYLAVEMKSGGWAFYHIPGRNSIPFDLVPISSGGLDYIRFQADDTNDLQGAGAATNMGFWRNQNEFYPNDPQFQGLTRDLRGQRVQHHKFPNLINIVGTYYSGNPLVGITQLPRLGINVSNVIIPSDIQAKIKRWKIVYAQKNDTNSLVTGGDILQFPASTDGDTNIRWSTSGNWILEAQGSGFQGFPILQKDSMRIHSLDYLFDKSTPPPTYAKFHYKLRRENINPQWTGFRTAGATMTISGENRGQSSTAVIDFTVPGQTTRFPLTQTPKKKLNNFAYLPQAAQNGKFKSLYTEGCFVADIESPGSAFDPITPIRLLTNSSSQSADANTFRAESGAVDPNVGEDTMYYQLYRILSDVHTSVFAQDIIPLESYASPSTQTLNNVYGGDTFLGYMSFLSASPLNSNPDGTLGEPTVQGVRIWRGYIGYSKRNFNYRHQIPGQIGTYYLGKTDPRTLFNRFADTFEQEYSSLISSNDPINVIEYNIDYNSLNEYLVGVIFNLDLTEATEFPNTIIWSPVQNEESKEFSWRSFPAGNRYVMPKNKGPIVNLQGIDNKNLIIHCTRSLYKTRTDIKLEADQDVFFKSAQLFEVPPAEVLSTTNGYGGTQNALACVLTKVGYVFPDNDQGKVFLFNDKLSEISTQGMRTFFRDFMKNEDNEDNPFNGDGYTMMYDERNNRLVLAKNADLSWTVSFNPQTQTWVSFHDWKPDYTFTTADNTVYSIKNNRFYLHILNVTYKGLFYDQNAENPSENIYYPSYIDIAYCPEGDRVKSFISTWWNTEMYLNGYPLGQPGRDLIYDQTCTHLTVRTYNQATARTPIVRQANYEDIYEANTRVIDRVWVYDNFRDIAIASGPYFGFYSNYDIDISKLDTNMEWSDQRKFMDKFVICRYEYDNLINNRWLFLESDITYRNEEI